MACVRFVASHPTVGIGDAETAELSVMPSIGKDNKLKVGRDTTEGKREEERAPYK